MRNNSHLCFENKESDNYLSVNILSPSNGIHIHKKLRFDRETFLYFNDFIDTKSE